MGIPHGKDGTVAMRIRKLSGLLLSAVVLPMALAVVTAPAAWAVDPVSVDVDTPSGPLHVTVTPGTWSGDPTDGTASGSGTLDLLFAGTSHTVSAAWSGVAFDVPTHKVTSGTIALTFSGGPAIASMGLEVKLLGLSLDAATGALTITGGTITAPSLSGDLKLSLSNPIDLAGTQIALSSSGLVSLECTVSDPISVLGVHLGAGAVLSIDLSDVAAMASIPDGDLSNPGNVANPGVAWRGIHLKGAPVSFGDAPPPPSGPSAATLGFLSVGRLGPATGLPDFKGRITTTSAAPLTGKVFGLEASLRPRGTSPGSGVLTFDSQATEVVFGTFDGVVKLPGGTTTAEVAGLVVAYGRTEGFQFVVDQATVTPPLDLGIGSFGAHVGTLGIDASTTKQLSSAPGSGEAAAFTGLVVYEGVLSFPVPGTDGGGALSLAMTDVVIPFGGGGQGPTQFDGWLTLVTPAPAITVGALTFEPLDAPTSGVALAPPVSDPAPVPPAIAGRTYFHFDDGVLLSGCLYGYVTVPGAAARAEVAATTGATSAGLASLECEVRDPISIFGVNLGAGASLAIDFSDATAVASIPDGELSNPGALATPGVGWRGIHLKGATVSFGEAATPAPGPTAATIEFLSVGWIGPTSGLPDVKGRITTTSAAPLSGKVFGLEARLRPSGSSPGSGILTFDSQAAEMVKGTFDGVVKLPGGTTTADVSGLVVAYGRAEGFQFLVDQVTLTPALSLGIGSFLGHVGTLGIDASTTKQMAVGPASGEPASFTGLVLYQGDLSFPVPGAHDGSVLALAVMDVVIPFAHPDAFDGWLMLAGGASSTIAKIGDLEIRATDTPQPPLTAPTAPPTFDPAAVPGTVLGHTYLHFVGGELVSGCLYGLLKVPGVPTDIGFGATVDAQGDLVADLSVGEIKVGQGDREMVFRNVAATLDLSQSISPSAAPSPQWTGLVLRTLEVTLPWPFQTATTITATDLLWDQGLSGAIALSAADAGTVIVVSDTDRFQAHLSSFSMRFERGGVEEVTATGTLAAKPFLDEVTFTVGYDAATGFLLAANSDAGVHVFGGAGTGAQSLLGLTFTLLELKIPTKAAYAGGAKPSLRMDGSVSVSAQGVSAKAFSFEELRLRSDGTVEGGGAWIDLRDHGHWEFQKFAVDVREIGCGSVPGANGTNQVWLGLSGGLALSDMWGMSVDVQANKFRWFQDHGFAVEEVVVKATVKSTVHIEGKVKYVSTPTQREFRGRLDAQIAVAGGSLAASLLFVSGHDQTAGFDYWGVAGSFQLPGVGVPLGATGLSLYGVNGGVSRHLTPNGVDMYDWTPSASSGFAFQAGVTLGTTSDTGYTFHAGVTMTVLLDPLIIRIDGTGCLLTAMSDVSNMDRIVKASLVYDSTTSTFEAKLELGQSDAQPFQFPHLASVRGMAVMHIEPTLAFLHVGTKQSPVTARLFPDIGGGITASSWFMVDWASSHSFSIFVGAYVAWSFTKEFKLCDVTGEIAAGGEVGVTVDPFTFAGSLSASIGAHACGFGFLLSANCSVTYPAIHVHAACTLEIDLAVKTVTLSVDVNQP